MQLNIPDDVVFRNLAGEAVLLHLGTGTYFGLDAVGTRIWELVAEMQSLDTITAALLREFDVEEQVLRRDIDALLGELVAQGLLLRDASAD